MKPFIARTTFALLFLPLFLVAMISDLTSVLLKLALRGMNRLATWAEL